MYKIKSFLCKYMDEMFKRHLALKNESSTQWLESDAS
jgi:hypothetical protein